VGPFTFFVEVKLFSKRLLHQRIDYLFERNILFTRLYFLLKTRKIDYLVFVKTPAAKCVKNFTHKGINKPSKGYSISI